MPVTLGDEARRHGAGARARPAQPAPAAVDRAVGVREDRRGLRPHLRLLRDPHRSAARSAAARRSRSSPRSTQLGAHEIVLVAQDLASLRQGRPGPRRRFASCRWSRRSPRAVPWVRLLYLYPSDLTDGLIDAICATGVPYFDLSLQHVSQAAAAADAPVGRRRPVPAPHRRHPRPPSPTPRSARTSSSATRARPRPITTSCSPSSSDAQLDWCGFFAYSARGRHLRRRPRRRRSPSELVAERLAELRELQDDITARKRDALIGSTVEVLVDAPGVGAQPP